VIFIFIQISGILGSHLYLLTWFRSLSQMILISYLYLYLYLLSDLYLYLYLWSLSLSLFFIRILILSLSHLYLYLYLLSYLYLHSFYSWSSISIFIFIFISYILSFSLISYLQSAAWWHHRGEDQGQRWVLCSGYPGCPGAHFHRGV
jgi:hypothetical protein